MRYISPQSNQETEWQNALNTGTRKWKSLEREPDALKRRQRLISFLARRGFTNGFNLDGNDLLQPRFGFNWTANDRLTIRGGAGLFGGGSPLIILSSSYIGNGITRTFFFPLAFMDPAAVAATLAELPDPTAAFRNLQSALGTDSAAGTDALDPGYEMLSTWKYSIGADYLADLSGIGMGDEWLFSVDVLLSEVDEAYDIFEARRLLIDTAPDDRPIYDDQAGGGPPGGGFNGDFITTNTSRGDATVYTLSLAKSFDTRAGMFDLTLGWAHQDVDELRSYNRFIPFETHVFDPGLDMNNPVVAPSRFEVEDRVTATLSWQKELFGDNVSSVGLVYAGRSGRHFSYVFGSNGVCTFGGSGLADCGAEKDTAGSQLFYVPTDPLDPFISGDPAFLADLDEFISTTDCLNDFRGSAVTRNNCRTSYTNVFSVRLMQEIKFGNMAFDLMLDIENFGNLLNNDWGRVESYTAPSNVAPANVEIPVAGGPYLLTPTASYIPGVRVVSSPEIATLPSVYRIQFGLRFRF